MIGTLHRRAEDRDDIVVNASGAGEESGSLDDDSEALLWQVLTGYDDRTNEWLAGWRNVDPDGPGHFQVVLAENHAGTSTVVADLETATKGLRENRFWSQLLELARSPACNNKLGGNVQPPLSELYAKYQCVPLTLASGVSTGCASCV